MSVRDTLLGIVRQWTTGYDFAAETPEALVDAHRVEVLAKAIGRLRAIPVDCTALTGPVWYGDGWNSAITCLEEIADYQVPDDEAYPGELQRLRALALGLRVAALRKEDLAEAQRLLLIHAEHERTARAAAKDKATATVEPATPDFFQVGHAYSHRDGSDFRCVAVTAHPVTGEPRALGWIVRNGWHDAGALDPDDWTHAYDGCEPPADTQGDSK